MPTASAKDTESVSVQIDQLILIIRGQRVILDSDLAILYGVPTKVLIQAVKRNIERFPEDFLFQLTAQEFMRLRSQFVTSKKGRGGRFYAPYAFTEQGVAMLSSVLHSPRAVQVNIEIMRAFVRLRRLLNSHEALSKKLSELEAKYTEHDEMIADVFQAIHQLMAPKLPKHRRKIGFNLHQ
jgi:hypothetical protein